MHGCVDKLDIALRYECHKDDEYQAIADFVRDVRSGETQVIGVGPLGKAWNPKPGVPLTCAHQPLMGGGALRVTYGYQPKSRSYWAWFLFNPAAISQLGDLEGALNIMLRYGRGTLMQKGRVNHVDFAVDIDGVDYVNYCFIDSSLRRFNDVFASKGTVYLGATTSALHWKIYNKRKQLAEKKGELLAHPRLRIEATVKPSALLLRDLSSTPNPFERLLVVDRCSLSRSNQFALAPLRQCADEGPGAVEAIFYSLTPKQRKLAAEALADLRPDWWQPKAAWQQIWEKGVPWFREWQPDCELAADWEVSHVATSHAAA